MFIPKNESDTEIRTNVRGGTGALPFRHILSQQQLAGRAEMIAEVTLLKGQSVGVHPHTKNAELYYIISGKAVVTENGNEKELSAGDAEFCANGSEHSIENRESAPCVFLAMILPDRSAK